ncbi:hypothetical protein [Brucella haematophila]|uniref:hypothetical protein n=1 Tax=Brucella haematophila TaxID=419474 RepID=UPI00110E1F83|nr:hypothetical protein [Brucella haematophila]TMV04494.1 hypothetical protein FGI60_06315 [Brucella haematophila]
MGGREAIRGFAIQTLLAVLEALDRKHNDWQSVIIEPDSSNDKVDILWRHVGRTRAQQVKSSKNQMGRGEVEGWCKDLADSKDADDYEILLAGPIAQSVIDDQPFHNVRVPTPRALDTLALMEQASNRLDAYLTEKGVPGVPYAVRADIVDLLASKVTDGAIYGREHTREQFDGMLLQWVAASYPQAIEQKLAANCEVLWDIVELHQPKQASVRSFELKVPVTIVNGGLGVAIVEWLVMKIVGPDGERRYEPQHPAEFAVLPGSKEALLLELSPTAQTGFQTGEWSLGTHRFQLYIKMRGVPPRLVKQIDLVIGEEHRAVLSGSTARLGGASIDLL